MGHDGIVVIDMMYSNAYRWHDYTNFYRSFYIPQM